MVGQEVKREAGRGPGQDQRTKKVFALERKKTDAVLSV